jgi:2-amino-4-hydroxy-6-hydroxymethyldihydropteridine diphosphokinase
VPWLALDPDATLAGVPVASLLDQLPPDDVAAIRLIDGARLR